MNAQTHAPPYSRDPAGPRVEILGPTVDRQDEVLTPLALQLLASLHRRFNTRRLELLKARRERQIQLDDGALPDFLPRHRRRTRRRLAHRPGAAGPARPARRDHRPRRPQDGHQRAQLAASVFMADFEDASSPDLGQPRCAARSTWPTPSAARSASTIRATGKMYGSRTARRRCSCARAAGTWRRSTCTSTASRSPARCSISASFSPTTTRRWRARGTGPYFYLPKMESHLEARLWNDVFVAAQDTLGIPRGTIKATVLIETLLAAFEMDEILYELREHSAGLNCGRWDYIFSFIKKLRNRAGLVLPDRARSRWTGTSCSLRRAAHQDLPPPRRARDGRHGGADPDQGRPGRQRGGAGARARRQAARGEGRARRHLGRASGPGAHRARSLRREHDRAEPARRRCATTCTSRARTCCASREGAITDAGLRHNIRVGVQYLEAWLRGNGCVPLYHLMEDAATAEISRAQVWQWLHHGAHTIDGEPLTASASIALLSEEMERIRRRGRRRAPVAGRVPEARGSSCG